jgi:hypothetical protein
LSSSEPSGFGVALFHSVHGAIAAERVLLAAGVAHQLVAVPRHLRSDCGFCLRFAWPDRGRVEAALAGRPLGLERTVAL